MLNLLRPLISRSYLARSNFLICPIRNNNSCKPKKPLSKAHAKVRKLQKHYQQDDGKPIFLKGGVMDQTLYRLTWTLALIGLLLDVKLYLGYLIA